MNGIIIVNKPVGYTSRDIVNIISKKLQTKKIGHTGTLDPIASGVLVVCVGRYTKLVDLLTSLDKEYIAEMKLGIKTDTLDITGKVLETKEAYYLYINKSRALIVDKKDMSDSDITNLTNTLKEQVSRYKEK